MLFVDMLFDSTLLLSVYVYMYEIHYSYNDHFNIRLPNLMEIT